MKSEMKDFFFLGNYETLGISLETKITLWISKRKFSKSH